MGSSGVARSSTSPRAMSSSRPLTASSSLRPLAARTTSKVNERPITEAVVRSWEAPSVSEARRPRSRSPMSEGAVSPPARTSRYATTRNGRPSLSRTTSSATRSASSSATAPATSEATAASDSRPSRMATPAPPRSRSARALERGPDLAHLATALDDDQTRPVVTAPVQRGERPPAGWRRPPTARHRARAPRVPRSRPRPRPGRCRRGTGTRRPAPRPERCRRRWRQLRHQPGGFDGHRDREVASAAAAAVDPRARAAAGR